MPGTSTAAPVILRSRSLTKHIFGMGLDTYITMAKMGCSEAVKDSITLLPQLRKGVIIDIMRFVVGNFDDFHFDEQVTRQRASWTSSSTAPLSTRDAATLVNIFNITRPSVVVDETLQMTVQVALTAFVMGISMGLQGLGSSIMTRYDLTASQWMSLVPEAEIDSLIDHLNYAPVPSYVVMTLDDRSCFDDLPLCDVNNFTSSIMQVLNTSRRRTVDSGSKVVYPNTSGLWVERVERVEDVECVERVERVDDGADVPSLSPTRMDGYKLCDGIFVDDAFCRRQAAELETVLQVARDARIVSDHAKLQQQRQQQKQRRIDRQMAEDEIFAKALPQADVGTVQMSRSSASLTSPSSPQQHKTSSSTHQQQASPSPPMTASLVDDVTLPERQPLKTPPKQQPMKDNRLRQKEQDEAGLRKVQERVQKKEMALAKKREAAETLALQQQTQIQAKRRQDEEDRRASVVAQQQQQLQQGSDDDGDRWHNVNAPQRQFRQAFPDRVRSVEYDYRRLTIHGLDGNLLSPEQLYRANRDNVCFNCFFQGHSSKLCTEPVKRHPHTGEWMR